MGLTRQYTEIKKVGSVKRCWNYNSSTEMQLFEDMQKLKDFIGKYAYTVTDMDELVSVVLHRYARKSEYKNNIELLDRIEALDLSEYALYVYTEKSSNCADVTFKMIKHVELINEAISNIDILREYEDFLNKKHCKAAISASSSNI